MSKLIPDELLSTIPDLYDTENQNDPLCWVKLFFADSNWTWFIIEYSKADKNTCYGYVQGFEDELGYFTLEELKSVKSGGLGLTIEMDNSFVPTPLSTIKKSEDENR